MRSLGEAAYRAVFYLHTAGSTLTDRIRAAHTELCSAVRQHGVDALPGTARQKWAALDEAVCRNESPPDAMAGNIIAIFTEVVRAGVH